MKENSFVIIFKEDGDIKNQLVLAKSHFDAQSSFNFEYLNRKFKILSVMSYNDILKKLDDLKNVYDDAKLVTNHKNELLEIRPHHPQYDDINEYLTKEQLKFSFVALLTLFKDSKEKFIVSSAIEVDWTD